MPRTGETHGQRLPVNGQVLTDKEAVLKVWAHHFEDLSSSKASKSLVLSNLEMFIFTYWHASFHNEDLVLDDDITTEEIDGIIKHLNRACHLWWRFSESVVEGFQ